MSIGFRYILFILSSTLAGFLSGLMLPLQFGVRGALLGGAISTGVIYLNPWQKDPAGKLLTIRQTLALSITVGGIAFLAIWAYQTVSPAPGDPDFGTTNFMLIPSAISCIIFAFGILLTTRSRLAGRRKAWIGFILTAAAGSLLRSWSIGNIATIPYTFFIGALPFVLLWLLAALLTDPAWSKQRWERISEKETTKLAEV